MTVEKSYRVFRSEHKLCEYSVREVDFDENPIGEALYTGDFENTVDYFNDLTGAVAE